MWVAWLLFAAQWYVDGDPEDCTKDVFCTLQEAVDNGVVPGDEILVRDAAMPYDGFTVYDVDGMDGMPIVVRPDDGHTPIIGGPIELGGSSFWTIRGLTFDGSGQEPGHSAIVASTSDPELVEGIVIENNTILDWGGPTLQDVDVGPGIIHLASYTPDNTELMVDAIVRSNRIIGSRGKAITMTDVAGATIEGNEAADLTCQMAYINPTSLENVGGMVGVHLYSSVEIDVGYNHFHDFDTTACTRLDFDNWRVAGVWLEGAHSVTVHHNLIARLGGQSEAGHGIALINGSSDASVHHNVVIEADYCGLCNGVEGSSGGGPARFVANTVIGGRGSAIILWNGEDNEFIGNVAIGAASSQVRLARAGVSENLEGVDVKSFENNLYFGKDGEANIGRFEYDSAVDFATWQDGCGCDADSVEADPMLAPGTTENFTAANESPVVDAAIDVPEAEAWNGEAKDLGAVEAPIVLGASIAAGEADRIRLELQSDTSPLRFDPGCSGFVVTRDGGAMTTIGCELDGASLIIELGERAYAGDAIDLAYAGTAISNSDAIGGFVHGLLQPFELVVDNGSQEVPPAESGESTSAESSGGTSNADTTANTSATDTDGGAADYPAADGCTCRTPSHVSGLWILIFGLSARSRSGRSRPRAAHRR